MSQKLISSFFLQNDAEPGRRAAAVDDVQRATAAALPATATAGPQAQQRASGWRAAGTSLLPYRQLRLVH
jgi:hypothetical protein